MVSIYFVGIVEPISTGQAAKDYLTRTVTPTLLKGLTELCKKKPADPIVSSTTLDSEETLPTLFLINCSHSSSCLEGSLFAVLSHRSRVLYIQLFHLCAILLIFER